MHIHRQSIDSQQLCLYSYANRGSHFDRRLIGPISLSLFLYLENFMRVIIYVADLCFEKEEGMGYFRFLLVSIAAVVISVVIVTAATIVTYMVIGGCVSPPLLVLLGGAWLVVSG